MSKTTAISQAEGKAPDADSPEVKIETRADKAGDSKTFGIVFNGSPEVVHRQSGRDALEAAALFNDGRKSWPSPKSYTVVEVPKGASDADVIALVEKVKEAKAKAAADKAAEEAKKPK